MGTTSFHSDRFRQSVGGVDDAFFWIIYVCNGERKRAEVNDASVQS